MAFTPALQRALIWLVVALVAGWLLHVLGPALTPIVLALALAYLLWPVVCELQRRGMPVAVATGLTIVMAMLTGAVLVFLLVPIVTTLLPMLHAQWPSLLDKFDRVVAPRLATLGLTLDTETIKEMVLKSLDTNVQAWGARLLDSARIGGNWVVTIIGILVLVPVLVYYVLVDAPTLTRGASGLVPVRLRPGLHEFLSESDSMLRQYLRGQVTVMLVLAVFYALGLVLTGLKLAWPIGVFTGLAVFIPYLGFGTGLVLALMTAAIQFDSWHGVAGVAAVYGLGQLLESFVLTPRLVGGRIGLSPLAVIVALLLFAQAFGFVGVLVALPASAVGVVALRRGLGFYRASAFYRT
ncbi:MAG TPA: AI-2E family transporter [Burkholderiaceae bacterium]|jgi:predicted PurR-regulated permease PerM|nr:AI-2E family transporter [Burkholderiaceae bacterium]